MLKCLHTLQLHSNNIKNKSDPRSFAIIQPISFFMVFHWWWISTLVSTLPYVVMVFVKKLREFKEANGLNSREQQYIHEGVRELPLVTKRISKLKLIN